MRLHTDDAPVRHVFAATAVTPLLGCLAEASRELDGR